MHIKLRPLLAIAMAALFLTACENDKPATTTPTSTSDASKESAASEAIALTVNGTSISEAKVALLTKHLASQGQGPADPAEARKMILEQLTMQILLSQDAAKKGLDKQPEIASQLELTRMSVLANAYLQDYVTSHPVSDEMANTEYDKFKTKFGRNEYKARHILVEGEDEAKSLITKLKANPKAFATLAKQHSKDPGSKDKGGELGWFDPSNMVPEFGTAVAALEKGHISDQPVKSNFGYHIIMLDDTRPKAIPDIDQVRPMLKQQLQQQNLKNLLDDLKAKAKIEISSAPAAAVTPPAAPAESPADAHN